MSDIYDMDSFTLNISGGYNTDNSPKAGTTSAKSGFIERKQRLVIDREGEERHSKANILIPYDPTITLEDSVTFDGVEHEIVSIAHPQDFTWGKTQLFLV